jgi:hypothetical protein
MTKEQKKEMFEAAFRQLMICDAFMALADFASKIEAQAKAAYRMMKGETDGRLRRALRNLRHKILG